MRGPAEDIACGNGKKRHDVITADGANRMGTAGAFSCMCPGICPEAIPVEPRA